MGSGAGAWGAALKSGYAWGGRTVTWSAPGRASDYSFSYSSDGDGDGVDAPHDGFSALDARQVASLRQALDLHGGGPAGRAGFAIEGFADIRIVRAADAGSADIRVANSDDAWTAYAFYPGATDEAGDVWFDDAGQAPRTGGYDHLTMLHEVGHAFGLDHAHDAGRHGAVAKAYDTLEYTVMSYRAWQGAAPNGYNFEDWGAPQSYMMLDIAALQQIYGANYRVNSDDTVYRWTPGSGRTLVDGAVALDPEGNRIFATVWDGGGRDRYDLSAYASDLDVDLRPGQHSVFARSQLADLGGGPNDGHARGNIFNALLHKGDRRSLIEDATGGTGDDRLVGNEAGNRLLGGDGDDCLVGLAGRDVLAGGRGADVFVCGSVGASPAGACDRLVRADGAAAFDTPGAGGRERIDLRGIDADTTVAGNQAFVFGTATGTGRLWLSERTAPPSSSATPTATRRRSSSWRYSTAPPAARTIPPGTSCSRLPAHDGVTERNRCRSGSPSET